MKGRAIRTLPLLAVSAFALTACGTKTITLNASGGGGSVSIVVTGDSDSVNSFQQGVSQAVAAGESSGANVSTVDGDQHTGNLVCSTTVSSGSQSAQLTVYSTISGLTSSICSQIQSSVQNAG